MNRWLHKTRATIAARISGPHESALPRISIDEALENNWLDIWYQPKIDLRRKCLAGAEALVRMQHPQAGFLWPEEYIDLLDSDGLTKLVEHTMATTLRHWTVFADAGFNLRLAINVPAALLPQLADQRTRCRPSSRVGQLAGHCSGCDRRSTRPRYRIDAKDCRRSKSLWSGRRHR